jgi:hypothetical protein
MEPREERVVEADAVARAEGSIEVPEDHGRGDYAGVGERGTRTEAPQEPGRSHRLLTKADQRASRTQARGLREPHDARAGADEEHEEVVRVRYRGAKETK